MNKLIDELIQFDKEVGGNVSDIDLQKAFAIIAPAFLYGGYIRVRNDYRVYIRTVEFYFHSEKGNGVHDPIVYHRNKRDSVGNLLAEIPYFPIMTLHAHASGFDIAFESELNEYRASALIRSYEVKDRVGKYLIWDKENEMFVESEKYGYNHQSTYLYDLLNGFPLERKNKIKWVDSHRKPSTPLEKSRQNVFQSQSEYKYMKIEGKRCNRKWSFTRVDQI